MTNLFATVSEWLSRPNSFCPNVARVSREGDSSLPEIAANICCQGALLLAGNAGTGERYYSCSSTCVRGCQAGGDKPLTVVSGTVVSGSNESQGVDVLVPTSPRKSSNQSVMHPGNEDILTVLMLALPPATWSGIRNISLLAEIRGLLSTDGLPDVLQDEVTNTCPFIVLLYSLLAFSRLFDSCIQVLHLRRQLHCLKDL